MTSTLTKPAATDPEVGTDHDERFVGLVSALLWKLEIRALSALYKSDNDDQAFEIIKEASTFREPIHLQMAERVSQAWATHHKDGKSLADALHTLDTDQDWWVRVQLPTAVSDITETEHHARRAVAQLWEELSHG